MKYMFLHDFLIYFKKKKILLISYICIIILYILFERLIGFPFTGDIIEKSLGLNCTIDSFFFDLIMYLYNIIFTILITIIIFNNDLKENTENIFLRISTKRWLFFKLINIILIIIITKILLFIPIIILTLYNKIIINELLQYFLTSIIIHIFIAVLVILLMFLKSIWNYSIYILIVICVINVKYLFVSFLNLNLYMISILTILLFITILLLNKKIYCLFEEAKK